MEIKQLEHSYLHNLFKAVLLYDVLDVKKILPILEERMSEFLV